jgi:RHS repeat-associated protein
MSAVRVRASACRIKRTHRARWKPSSGQLVHMNGRVYDYQLGRFLSVDPMIQAPLNSQSLNPYSYIMNNPLAGTDPTGYSSCAVGDSAGDCAAGLGEGQTSELKGMDTGSHIVHDEGSVTGTGGGSYSFSAKAGSGLASFTYNGGNGTVTQGVTGAGGRQDQAASNSEKGSASNVAASPSASPAENDPMASKDPPSAYQASDQGSPEDHFIPIDPSQYPSYLKDARDVVKQKFLEPAQFATDALKQSYLHLLDEINLAGSDQRLGWGALADFGRVKITFYGEFLEIQTFRDGTKLEHRVSTVERLGQIMTHEIRHLTEANHRIPESRVDSDLDLLNGAHHDASPRERDADRFEQQIWEHKGGPVNDF